MFSVVALVRFAKNETCEMRRIIRTGYFLQIFENETILAVYYLLK